jgi:large subunit ribosomal protein L7/L12
MAKLTKEEFISSLKEMTILEVKELVDAMVEEFGINLNAVAVAAAPAEGSGESSAPSTVNLVLTNAGGSKIPVIKLIREITGLGLKEAKDIADNGGTVKEAIKVEEANELKAKFEEAGATVELQ